MADLFGTLPPELALEQQRLNRQQKMAEMLLAQGAQPQAAGQMVSGRYVPNSFFQNLQGPVNMMLGAYMANRGDEKSAELTNRYARMQQEAGQRIADALIGTPERQEPDIPTETYETVKGRTIPAVAGSPQLALAEALKDQTGVGRPLIPAIIERAMPKPIAPTNDIQNYQFMKESGQLPKGMTFLGYQTYLKELGKTTEKAPAGYRFAADGSLEPIKGGPADLKSQQKFAGQENVDTLIGGLRDQYNVLLANNGITSKEAGTIPNLRSAISRSAVGQTVGQAVGSTNQSARNTIAQSRPLLLNAIKEATGMSAKQMDSNAELKMYLAAATDPTLDYESNMYALNQLETLFGTPAANRQTGGNVPSTNAPSTPQTNAPQAKPAEAGKPVYATNPNTKQRIVSTDGGITWKPAPKAQ